MFSGDIEKTGCNTMIEINIRYLLFIFALMKSVRDSMLSKIKSVIKQTDPRAVAILYGSRAAGRAEKNSDWDILILVNQTTVSLKDEQEFRHSLYDLELETGEHISTFVYAESDWNTRQSITPIYRAVTENGIIL